MWNTNILMKKNSHSRVTQTICSLAPIKDYGLNYGAGVGIRTLDFNPGKVEMLNHIGLYRLHLVQFKPLLLIF